MPSIIDVDGTCLCVGTCCCVEAFNLQSGITVLEAKPEIQVATKKEFDKDLKSQCKSFPSFSTDSEPEGEPIPKSTAPEPPTQDRAHDVLGFAHADDFIQKTVRTRGLVISKSTNDLQALKATGVQTKGRRSVLKPPRNAQHENAIHESLKLLLDMQHLGLHFGFVHTLPNLHPHSEELPSISEENVQKEV